MPKIYNEIVIDMNPESSTFEEVLHEDSYEYEGEMILAYNGGADAAKAADIRAKKEQFKQDTGVSWEDYFTKPWEYPNIQIPEWATTSIRSNLETKILQKGDTWGAETISKADFVDPITGKPLLLEQVYTNLDPKIPGKSGNELRNLIKDMAPKYSEDIYGMGKEKEFAKEAYKEDIYGLQAGARKIGGAMRQTYGGMGGGMRAGIGATGALGTQFAQAGQQYKKSMYDIEQAGEAKYERDIEGWLDEEWFKAKEGGYVKRDRSGITNNLEETFLDVLSQLPDAGGS